MSRRFSLTLKSNSTELFGKQDVTLGTDLHRNWSFMGGSRVVVRSKPQKFVLYQKASRICASCDPFCLFYYILVISYQYDLHGSTTEIQLAAWSSVAALCSIDFLDFQLKITKLFFSDCNGRESLSLHIMMIVFYLKICRVSITSNVMDWPSSSEIACLGDSYTVSAILLNRRVPLPLSPTIFFPIGLLP